MNNLTQSKFLEEKDFKFIDTNQIDELMSLFEMHNLLPDLSKHDHVFANSLAILLTSLNWQGTARHLFESLPYIKGREIDLLDILNTMANLGYSNHRVSMSIKNVDPRLMPCLFIPKREKASPLVLLAKEGDLIKGFHSKKKQKIEFNVNDMDGEAIFFKKIIVSDTIEDLKTKKSAGLSWFAVLFQRFRPILKEVFIVSLLLNLLSLSMPLFITPIYDRVIGAGSTDTLFQLVIGVSIAMIAEAILRLIRLRSVVWLGVRLDNIVSNVIFERLLLMKASYTEGASISDQISRLKTFESIRQFFTGPLFLVIIELPFTLVLMAVIWFISGPLVYIPMIVFVLYLLLMLSYHSALKVAVRASAKERSQRQKLAMETFLKLDALHHNGMARNWWLQYKEAMAKSSITTFKAGMISSVIEAIAHGISISAGLAIVSCGVFLIWDGTITIGALVTTMLLIWRVLGPLQSLCSMIPRLEQLKDSIEQINRLVSIEVESLHTSLKKPIKNLKGHIKLSNVGLRYSVEVEPLFVGLDLEVQPGEIIAITGVNGSGKTSVLKLINGLYMPQTGTISVDGINIRQMQITELRNYISYMPQVPNFFEGTIKENLLLANPLATDEQILDAIDKSSGLEILNQLENGINTVIYANNPSLPSGFEYSMNLARVILRNSNIVMLDEIPNAWLNDHIGLAYKKLIQESKGKRTVFFITQRSDYLAMSDKVITLIPGTRPSIMRTEEFIKKHGL